MQAYTDWLLDTITDEEQAEYGRIIVAEHDAEVAYWQGQRLAAQLVAMMGPEEYRAAVELQELLDAREDEEWIRGGC